MPPDSLLALWRQTNQRANELERQLFEASLLYARGAGPKPTTAQWDEAVQARREASEHFRRAMQEYDDAACAARAGLAKLRGGSGSPEGGSTTPG